MQSHWNFLTAMQIEFNNLSPVPVLVPQSPDLRFREGENFVLFL